MTDFYKQYTRFGGAATGLMYIINSFVPSFKVCRENEFLIWLRTANLPFRGSSVYALALFASQFKIDVEVFVGRKEIFFPNYRFKGVKKSELKTANNVAKFFYKQVIKEGIKVNVMDFDFSFVKKKLLSGYVLLLKLSLGYLRNSIKNESAEISFKKAKPRYVPVMNYGNEKFVVADPVLGKIVVDEKILQESFNMISSKCKTDNRMITFKLKE